jgi:hypothetical protein
VVPGERLRAPLEDLAQRSNYIPGDFQVCQNGDTSVNFRNSLAFARKISKKVASHFYCGLGGGVSQF